MGKPRATSRQVGISLVLALVCLVFLGDQFNVFEGQELGFIDLRFKLRPAQSAHPDIVVVEVDDLSVNRIGHWPWPRSYHATLLNVLSSYHPRLILYDVLFTEKSTPSKEDELLAFAIRKAGNVVVPFFFRSEEPFIAFFPIEPIREAAGVLGYVNIFPDLDGRVRRVKAFVDPHPAGHPYFHTSVAAMLSLLPEENRRRLLELLPLERDHSFWVNYPGNFSLFRRIPFSQIIKAQGTDETQLRKLFEGKIVVVGVTATGSGDLRPTPFSPMYPGMGIQASALHTLFTGQYLRRIKGGISLAILLLLALLASYLTWRNPPVVALVTVLILTGFYFAWNFFAFIYRGWMLPVFPVLLVIGGTYLLVLFLQYVEIRLEGELLIHELSLAARIQENFLPRVAPKMPGFDVGFHCQFAKMVGGDLYDWVALGNRKLGICVGDVSGKGVPAALYMSRVISEWRTLARNFYSSSELLNALNNELVSSGMEGIFVTLLYLILDLDSRSFLFSNAGHEPLFFYRRRVGKGEWIRRAGAFPLGLFLNGRYPEEALSFEAGDFLLLVSDGVRELRNSKGQELGLAGIEKAAVSAGSKSAEEMVKEVFRSMDHFSKGRPAHDDRTALCIKIKGGNA